MALGVEWTSLLTIGAIGIASVIGIALILKYAGLGEFINLVLNAFSNIVGTVTRAIQWAPRPLAIGIFFMMGMLLLPLITTLILAPTYVCTGQDVADQPTTVLWKGSYVSSIFAKFQSPIVFTGSDVQERARMLVTGEISQQQSLFARILSWTGMKGRDPFDTPFEGSIITSKEIARDFSGSDAVQHVVKSDNNAVVYLMPTTVASVDAFMKDNGEAKDIRVILNDGECRLTNNLFSSGRSVLTWRYNEIDNPGYAEISDQRVLEITQYVDPFFSDALMECERPVACDSGDSAAECMNKIQAVSTSGSNSNQLLDQCVDGVLIIEPFDREDVPSMGCVRDAHYLSYNATSTGIVAQSRREFFIKKSNEEAKRFGANEGAETSQCGVESETMPFSRLTCGNEQMYGTILTYECDKDYEVTAGLFGIPLFTRTAFQVIIAITMLGALGKMLKLF